MLNMKIRFLIAFFAVLFANTVIAQLKTGTASVLGSVCDISPNDSLYLYVRAVNCWKDVDNRKALDTVRLYVERHPFATSAPGKTIIAISYTVSFTAWLPNSSDNDIILNYNWLVKVQPFNMQPIYQAAIIATLANDIQG